MTNEERQQDQASTDGMREPSFPRDPACPETVEQEIQRKGLTAPRVTPADIEANIAHECYFTGENAVNGDEIANGRPISVPPRALKLLTFCVLVLRNGFAVHGVSACASPENFNAELGRRIARENAVREMWPLMGYALKQQLHEGARPDPDAR